MQQSLDQDQGQVKDNSLYPGVAKDHTANQTPNSTSSSSASPPTVLKREQDPYPGQIQLYPTSPYSEHQLQQQEPADQHKYNLSKHLLAMNMSAQQHHQQHSTPASAFSTAPSSPTLNPLQYNPNNNSGGNNNNINSTNASGTTTPYSQHPSYSYHSQSSQHHPLHPYHYQQHQQAPDLANSYYYNHNNSNNNGNGTGANPVSSTAPSPMRQQQAYSSLAPPLTDSQYAQMLGPFGSTQSTPYHSSQSTPYSSIPPSPTQTHAQLYGGDHSHERIKRRQVKNACVNCQKACKKCDEGRPCSRCIKYGLVDTCVDSTRKVRKKGIKRGPYKRRPPPSATAPVSTTASASTTPTLRHAALPGYLSTPVSALGSPTQAHTLPFNSTSGNGSLDIGYDNSGSSSSAAGVSTSSAPPFHSQYPHQSQQLYQSYQHPYQQYPQDQGPYSGQQGIYGSTYGISTVGHYSDEPHHDHSGHSRNSGHGNSAGGEGNLP